MKILAVRAAKAIWLVPTAFMNPTGRYIYADIAAIRDRYSFLKSPLDKKLPPDHDDGYKFENGAFQIKNVDIEIVLFAMHLDGIVVETRSSTDDSELFLNDFFVWATKELGFAKATDLPFKKIYSNELNFTLDKSPAFLNPALSSFFEAANSAIGKEAAGGSDFVQATLGTDVTRNKSQQTFTIAREINTAIGDNRYHSFASTTTKAHIAILEKLEKLTT